MTAQLLNRRYHDSGQALPFACDLLVLSLPSAEQFYSFLSCLAFRKEAVFDVLQYCFSWAEASASSVTAMTIHQGNTVLWAGDGCTTTTREYDGFRGRRRRGTKWETQMSNLRSPFQESDRFWFLYPPLFDKSLPVGVKSVTPEPCCFTKLFILFL